ncbi:hypothetical protein ACCS72_38870, partial [Rhizobium ruizarguesonis]
MGALLIQAAPSFLTRSGPLVRLALFSLAAAMPFFIADSARADFRVCNGTQNLVGVMTNGNSLMDDFQS